MPYLYYFTTIFLFNLLLSSSDKDYKNNTHLNTIKIVNNDNDFNEIETYIKSIKPWNLKQDNEALYALQFPNNFADIINHEKSELDTLDRNVLIKKKSKKISKNYEVCFYNNRDLTELINNHQSEPYIRIIQKSIKIFCFGKFLKKNYKIICDTDLFTLFMDSVGQTVLHFLVKERFKQNSRSNSVNEIEQKNHKRSFGSIKKLIKENSLIEIKNIACLTVLALAVNEQDIKLIKFLLKYGANPNTKLLFGITALSTAILKNNIETFNLLVEYNANTTNIDDFGSTPLHDAARVGLSVELVQFLLKHNAINSIDKHGQTALHYALDIETKRGLTKNNEINDMNNNTQKNIDTQRDSVIDEKTRFAIVKLLLEHNVPINAKDKWEKTALDYAEENEHTQCIILLNKYNAEYGKKPDNNVNIEKIVI